MPDQDPQLAARLRKKVFDEIPNRLLEYLILTCDPREYRNKEIAEIMKVEPGTVDGYQKDFARKFGVRSKQGVVLFAFLWDIPGMVRERERHHPPHYPEAGTQQATPGP